MGDNPRREAILIKPANMKTYVDVLGTIRNKVSPTESGAEIRGIRKTRLVTSWWGWVPEH